MSSIGTNLNGYTIKTEFSTVGGGMCRWAFAEKGEKSYFVKEFLSPKYPTDTGLGSPKTKARKMEACKIFEAHQKEMMVAIKSVSGGSGGNLVAPIDFFRIGPVYYKVTEKIDVSTLSPADISRLPDQSKLMILKTVTHSLGILHNLDIVHGDLKPDNVLIKLISSKGPYVAKLIDMDNSYFSGRIPSIQQGQDVVGTPNYYSPELGAYIIKQEDSLISTVKLSSDIFALGLMFCEYLTGKLPVINEKYQYAWEAILDGETLVISGEEIGAATKSLISEMLSPDPEKRPSCSNILARLKDTKSLDKSDHKESKHDDSGKRDDRLRGSMFTKPKASPPPKSEATGKLVGSIFKANLKKDDAPKEHGTLLGKLLRKKLDSDG